MKRVKLGFIVLLVIMLIFNSMSIGLAQEEGGQKSFVGTEAQKVNGGVPLIAAYDLALAGNAKSTGSNLRFADSAETDITDTRHFSANETASLKAPAVTNDDLAAYPISYVWTLDGETVSTGEECLPSEWGTYICTVNDTSLATLTYRVAVTSDLNTSLTINGELFEESKHEVLASLGEAFTANVVVQNALGAETYKWGFKNTYDAQFQTIGSSSSLSIDSLATTDFGYYQCEIFNGTQTKTYLFYLKPDTGIAVSLDPVSLAADGSAVITGYVTAKKTDIPTLTGERQAFEIYLVGDYIARDQFGKIRGSDYMEKKLDELSEVTDGQWSAATVSTEDTSSITLQFTVKVSLPCFVPDRELIFEYFPTGIMAYDGHGYIGESFELPFVEDYLQGEAVNHEAGVKILGIIPEGSTVEANDIADEPANAMQGFLKEGESLLWGKNIVLQKDGIRAGHFQELTIFITVGQQYNGQTMKVLHYRNGKVEELSGVVKDGELVLVTSDLSPFGVVVSKTEGVGGVTDKPRAPKTDDASMSGGLLCLMAIISGALFAYMIVVRKGRIWPKHE